MEENQNQNPVQSKEDTGKKVKKKGLGPLKGTLLAILIVLLICIIGLLVRMVIAGDGDYFKPFKQLFGIEEKEDEEDEKVSKKFESGKDKDESTARYALLSDKVDKKGVKHYRLTISLADMFDKIMDEATKVEKDVDEEEKNNEDEDSENLVTNEDEDSEDLVTDDNNDSDNEIDTNTDSKNKFEDELSDAIDIGTSIMKELGDKVDGELYLDVYFKENEIVQVILGFDYTKLAENLYNYSLENDEEELKDEDINSLDDYLDYINDEFSDNIDKDTIVESIIEDDDVESTLEEYDISEEDLKDALDVNCDKGIIELYLNGTKKLKDLVSNGLESDEFKDALDKIEDETGDKIDEDNVIESLLKTLNDYIDDTDELQDMGIDFEEVK